ncbi:MAG: carboxypeptidase-like regulatory domain-containing protein [Tannerellaceae bacterium]|jgi:hypothetical protein|nr:carboxypeptidase-like regulatory domain-containing protein [Tannerellaceae bacterium]
MKKNLIILFLFIAINPLIISQKLTGRVFDISNSPIENAKIILYNNDSILSINFTNKNGDFLIKYEVNNFDVAISCLGYKENKISIVNATEDVKMKDIILIKDVIELDEIVVNARNIINYGNRIIVFPSKKDVENSNSSIELFQKSNFPGLSVNLMAQSISIDGKSNITYRINGINSSLQEVLSLSPEQISHVEYQRIASDIRDIESVGIINVNLKKSTGTFLSSSATGALATGFLNGNLNLTSGYTNSNITFNYGINWRDYSKRISLENESYLNSNKRMDFYKIGNESPFGYLQQNINLGYTYNKGKNILSAKFLNNIYSSHDKNDIDIYNNIDNQYLSNRYISSQSHLYIPALDLYYIHKFDDLKRIEMNIGGSISTSDFQRDVLEQYFSTIDSINTNLNGKAKSFFYELYYANNAKLFNYNLGFKVSYSDVRNKSIWTGEKDSISRLDIYPYLSLNGKLLFLNYNFGIGLKILNNNANDLSKTYIRNLSNLSLYYSFKNLGIQYSLHYTPNYPQISNMTNMVLKQDPYLYISGNSSLTTSQQLANNLEISYNHTLFSTSISFYALHEFDPIREIVFFEKEKYISRFENINKEKNYGVYFYSFIPSIFNMFKLKFDLGFNYYKSLLDNMQNNSLTNFHYSAHIEYYYKNFSLSIGWKKPTETLKGEFIIKGENNSYVNASYKIKNLLIGAALYYPLTSGSKYNTIRNSDQLYSNREIIVKDNANMFVIGVVYTMDWGRSLFNLRKTLNNIEFNNPIMTIKDN